MKIGLTGEVRWCGSHERCLQCGPAGYSTTPKKVFENLSCELKQLTGAARVKSESCGRIRKYIYGNVNDILHPIRVAASSK